MANLRLVCLALVAALLVAVPLAESGISCGQVASFVAPCIGGHLKPGGVTPRACCIGIMTLNNAARTTPDRQAACRCLQGAPANVRDLYLNLAAGLPGKCGVSVPYKISSSTDCSRVR